MQAICVMFLLWLSLLCPALAQDSAVKQLTASQLQTITRLNGNWDFINPEGQHQKLNVPGAWEKNYDRPFLPHYGQGVYQLRLKLPPEAIGEYFKVYTALVGGESFKFYVDGKLLGYNGFKPNSTSRVTQFSPFIIDKPEMTLRFEIQNTKLHNSGLIRPVLFGKVLLIDKNELQFKMVFNLIIGVFLFLGVFHLLLYAGFRQEKALLWFALLCLSLGCFGEFYQVRNLEYFFGDMPIDVSARLVRLALFSLVPTFLWYSHSIAPPHPTRRYLSLSFVKNISWLNLAFILTLLLPTSSFTPFMALWSLSMTLCLIYNIYRLLGYRGQRKAYSFLFSGLLFSLALIHDFLNGVGILHTGNVSRYSMLLFCLLQAGFLAWRMQQAHQQSLTLQAELREVNHNLEGLVSQRTQEVRSKNDELQQLVAFKDEMTRMMVHDLKAPLSTLMNLPARQIAMSEPGRKSFEAASQRMFALVENMLHIKHNDKAEWKLNLTRQPLESLTAQVLLSLANWAQSKKITIHNQVDASHELLIDKILFERLLLNLLDNAIKQTPIGGSITLRTRQAGESLDYLISDTGPGIPPAQLEQVFEQHQSFAQGETPRSSGLGLYFCRQVANAHGGKISLTNLAGGGLQVTLSLPALADAGTQLTATDWNPSQLALIGPVAERLRQLEVFEIGRIQTIIKHLRALDDARIQAWLLDLDAAIRDVNEKTYAELIAQIPSSARC